MYEEQAAEAQAQYKQDQADGKAQGMEAAQGAEQAALDESYERDAAARQDGGEHRFETYQDSLEFARLAHHEQGLTYEELHAQVEQKKREALILEGRRIQFEADKKFLEQHLHISDDFEYAGEVIPQRCIFLKYLEAFNSQVIE